MWREGATLDPDPAPYLSCICVPTHHYWSIPFSAVKSTFWNFFTSILDMYVTEVLVIHFLQILPSNFLSPYENQSEANFFQGSTPDPYLGCNFLTLI